MLSLRLFQMLTESYLRRKGELIIRSRQVICPDESARERVMKCRSKFEVDGRRPEWQGVPE